MHQTTSHHFSNNDLLWVIDMGPNEHAHLATPSAKDDVEVFRWRGSFGTAITIIIVITPSAHETTRPTVASPWPPRLLIQLLSSFLGCWCCSGISPAVTMLIRGCFLWGWAQRHRAIFLNWSDSCLHLCNILLFILWRLLWCARRSLLRCLQLCILLLVQSFLLRIQSSRDCSQLIGHHCIFLTLVLLIVTFGCCITRHDLCIIYKHCQAHAEGVPSIFIGELETIHLATVQQEGDTHRVSRNLGLSSRFFPDEDLADVPQLHGPLFLHAGHGQSGQTLVQLHLALALAFVSSHQGQVHAFEHVLFKLRDDDLGCCIFVFHLGDSRALPRPRARTRPRYAWPLEGS
mmetsp:Transcript_26509/g.61863  ORF Transcript_26509/g.61863 Transcript_26509/m.61863 type:complete len:346 (-) Transcript_26509:34-1071(-)